VLEDRSLPSFLAPVSYPVGVNPQAVAVGAFTGDGIPDLVVANHDSGTVSVLLGRGDGTFGPAQNYAVGGTPVSVAVGDFNNDGKVDIVTTNDSNGTVSVLLGNGNGTFQPALNYVLPAQRDPFNWYGTPLAQTPVSLAVGDFNKDGKLDIAVTANTYSRVSEGYGGYAPYYNGYVNVLIGNGAGGFSADNSYALGSSYDPSTAGVAVGDFRGNGNLDLAVANGGVALLLGNGDGTFGTPTYLSGSATAQSVAVGDFNGDHKLDLVTGNLDGSGNSVSVLLGNGNGTFGTATFYPTRGSGVAVADFNRDGKLDLAVSGSRGVSALLGMGDGTFAAGWDYAAPYAAVAVGDFNRDGWPDLATVSPSANTVSVFLNARDWSAAPQASSFAVSGFPSPITAGTAGSFTVTAKKADGTTATGYTGTVHFTSSNWYSALPADYTFTAADAGVHTFSAVLDMAGTQSLTASDTVTASITGTQTGITVNPAAARAFQVAGFPSPINAGVAGTFTVTATDAYGNRTSYLGSVHFTSSDPQAVLPADYTFTAADAGMHTFSATLKTATGVASDGQSLTATAVATASISGTQAGIIVNPGAAATFWVDFGGLTPWPPGQPTPGYTAGVAWQFEVLAMDAYGNVATGYTGTVHFTSSDTHAVLPASYTFTAADRGAHFFYVTPSTPGWQTITATDTLFPSITASALIDVVAQNAHPLHHR
jgi:hypothetical protein